MPDLVFLVGRWVVSRGRPPLGWVKEKGVALAFKKRDRPVVLEQVIGKGYVSCVLTEFGPEVCEMAKVQQRRKGENSLGVVASDRPWNGEAQLAQTVLEPTVIEIEPFLQHRRVGILIQK